MKSHTQLSVTTLPDHSAVFPSQLISDAPFILGGVQAMDRFTPEQKGQSDRQTEGGSSTYFLTRETE